MLSANELRIGNCVKDHTGAVRFISHRKLSDIASNPDNHGYEPIPLLPEILKACGFIDGQKMFSYHTHIRVEPYQTLAQGIFPGEWSVTLLDTIPHRLGNSIKHVHQLQNLYHALTGSELHVNLKEKV